MLDLKEIRRDPDAARAALERRRAGERLDEVLRLDERRRELLPQVESLRAERNSASEAIGRAKKAGEDASSAIAAMQELAPKVKALEEDGDRGLVEGSVGCVGVVLGRLGRFGGAFRTSKTPTPRLRLRL